MRVGNTLNALRKSGWLAALLVMAAFGPGPEFQQRLSAAHMTLTVPSGWVETPVIANVQVGYEYALRYPGRRIEVRYAVMPAANGKAKPIPSSLFNQMAMPLFQTTLLNIGVGGPDNTSNEDGPPMHEFPAQAVKAEFGADWGVTSGLRPGPEFGQTYKNCMVVALHKKDTAIAYCFYLFDNKKDLEELVLNDPKLAVFHSLRFE